MSVVQLIVTLVLLAVGGALLFRWLQQRGDDAWTDGVARIGGLLPRRGERVIDHLDDDVEDEEEDTGPDGGNGARGARGGRVNQAGLRRRGGGNPRDAPPAAVDVDEYDENGVKLTRLQRKKLAKEREKEERRQAQEAALAARHDRSDASTLLEAEAALKEEEMKRAEEVALQELREDKKRADNAEYAKWVGEIGVEERGELGDETRERQARVQAFLLERAAKVQARALAGGSGGGGGGEAESDGEGHVLVLQSAARALSVSVEELVNTIEAMTRDGTVDGVFDDRGKYVFIAPLHFPLLAQFIRQRGRVSVHEFTRECNRIIMQS